MVDQTDINIKEDAIICYILNLSKLVDILTKNKRSKKIVNLPFKLYRHLTLKIYSILNNGVLFIYNKLPIRTRWKRAQSVYIKWTHKKLPDKYINQIIDTGIQFASFIKEQHLTLDVGWGNGLIGGVAYEEAGYRYLFPKRMNKIIGIDPLPPEGPKPPWYDECLICISENLPFRNIFDNIIIATTLDHVSDPVQCLVECSKILKSNLYIWITCLKKPTSDIHHPIRYSKNNIVEMLSNTGYVIIRIASVNKTIYGEEMFIEAQRKK